MNGHLRSASVRAWAALGLAGSLTIAWAGPRAVSTPATGWWYMPALPGGRSAANVLVYVGVGVLCLAWVGVGRSANGPGTRWLLIIAGLWLTPLALAPPMFSHDAYSYLAQGTVLHLGHNPYHDAPAVLAGLGRGHVLAGVAPFWRHTTAPYGPLFLGAVSLIVAVTGSHLVAGILVLRALELIGIVLIARYVPRLAGALGADAARATWLALLSPIILLQLVAAAHNDVLMAGLLVAGITVALQGRPLAGVALCALAATFKVPGLAGAAFITVAWMREEHTPADRVRFLLGAVLSAGSVLTVVSLGTDLGLSWLSSSVFAAPARVRLAITPATQVGYTVVSLLHDAGVKVRPINIESAFTKVSTALIAGLGLWLLYRARIATLASRLGLLLLLVAAGGPATWPWYFSWGLVLLAGCPGIQRSRWLVALSVASVFVIKPSGILALPLPSAPWVMGIYVVLAVWFLYARRRGRGPGDAGRMGGYDVGRDPDSGDARRAALTLVNARTTS